MSIKLVLEEGKKIELKKEKKNLVIGGILMWHLPHSNIKLCVLSPNNDGKVLRTEIFLLT